MVCGPSIDEVFLFNIDDLVPGGANLMIEVLRQTIAELAQLLVNVGLNLPGSLSLQFDNCGENKNKFMFGYLTQLVQENFFNEIDCNFLVVGHTHTSIDQYFGSLTKAIDLCKSIASPLSLWHVLRTVASSPDSKAKNPIVCRQISAVFDYAAAYAPYLNPITYYQIPHNFRFRKLDKKLPLVFMQYRLFSSYKTWLPRIPDQTITTLNEINSRLVDSVALSKFCIAGDEDRVRQSVIEPLVNLTDEKELRNQLVLVGMLPALARIELHAIDAQQQRFDDEADGGAFAGSSRYESRQKNISTISKYLLQNSNNDTGFLVWFNATKLACSPVDALIPNLTTPIEDVRNLIATAEQIKITADSDEEDDNNIDTTKGKIFVLKGAAREKTSSKNYVQKMLKGAKSIVKAALRISNDRRFTIKDSPGNIFVPCFFFY